MIKNLEFCTLTFGEDYVISRVSEGIVLSVDKAYEAFIAILQEFQEKPFVYIGHRENSYSVDPLIYKEASIVSNLKGIAIVSENFSALNNVEIERLFLQKPFEGFSTIEEAIEWAEKTVHKKLA